MYPNNINLNSWPEKFKYLFEVAKKTINRNILNIDEITVGYYRLITVPYKQKVVDKIAMFSTIYRYSNQNKNARVLPILERVSCGKYKLVDNFDQIFACNEEYKASDKYRNKAKVVMYKGKKYPSMTALAHEIKLDLSTVSRCYKRHNGDLTNLGKNRRSIKLIQKKKGK